jgi:hypothetical protein
MIGGSMLVSPKTLSLSENLEFESHPLKNDRDTKINREANQRLENNNFSEKKDSIKINSIKAVDPEKPNFWTQCSSSEILSHTNDHHQQLPVATELTKKLNQVDFKEEKKNVGPTSERTYGFQNVVKKVGEYIQFFFHFLFRVTSELIRFTAKCMVDVACFSFHLAKELTIIRTLNLKLNFGRPSDHIQNQVVNHNVSRTVNNYCINICFSLFQRRCGQLCGHSQ